ncbi:MAG: GcrA cell cycle regulator, partial [Porphyrobacter sp.]|nr:GcrA cell cycle regulator [Porphyrobacter sp.]
MSWTDERIATLRKMWEGGATASEIATELGGVSRNAVIGKAHRLGLKSRPSPVKANEQKKKAAAPAAKKPSAPAPVTAARAPTEPAERIAAEPAERPVPRAAAPAAPRTEPVADSAAPAAPAENLPKIVSVGPGGFLRQGPGDQRAPIPPAPPRRLVPAKPSPEIAGKTSLL